MDDFDLNPLVKESKNKDERRVHQELKDLEFVLSNPEGRRFIGRLLDDSGVHSQTAVNSGSWTYFNEGRRSLGRDLFIEIMGAFPNAYALILKEKDL